MISLRSIKTSYQSKKNEIQSRLKEFEKIGKDANNERLFEELTYCIFTAGASAKMGLNAVKAIKHILPYASKEELSKELRGVYRFPNVRSSYIVHTRNYLSNEYNMNIKGLLYSFENPLKRRSFFAKNKDIKGLGFKESSHFLRNIGFKNYGILDKHMINCMYELKIIKSNKPPVTEKKYLEFEYKLKKFSHENKLNFDELDLLLWSEKTGLILK